jgi:hypothetical protein
VRDAPSFFDYLHSGVQVAQVFAEIVFDGGHGSVQATDCFGDFDLEGVHALNKSHDEVDHDTKQQSDDAYAEYPDESLQ